MKKSFLLVACAILLCGGLVRAADSPQDEVLALTRELLENIYVHPNADFYAAHVDADVTAYEGTPARQDGIAYHLFMLRQLAAHPAEGAVHLELLNPKVQLFGDVAIVTATSQVTRVKGEEIKSSYLHETRVWVRRKGEWKLVHFHKSSLPERDED
jgi:ketosteroid isomerase-like protein